MPNRDEDNPYATRYINDAPRVGTASFQRNMSDELTRLQEANRIQRQTVSSSYAQQYEQARGNMMRGQMAGAAPGLTGGLAQQRTSEISGAQMRGLSQLSGQREQALREVDYQGLMANRQAFDFAQQQTMAQRDEQMFNLQMIQSRQGILDSDMSDADKREALMNTGMSSEEIENSINQKNRGFFEKVREGEASGLAVGATAAGVGTAGFVGGGLAKTGITYGAASLATAKGGTGFSGALATKLGLTSKGGTAAAAQWANTSQGAKAVKALKTTKLGKVLAGKGIAGKGMLKGGSIAAKALLTNPVGWGILAAAAIIGVGYGVYKWGKNSDRW